ncbi:MAG: hypothetical protein JXD23_07315 [Spirochaetales bacterium]|nr:hypothetical protein [Spirochaetales bacterium]
MKRVQLIPFRVILSIGLLIFTLSGCMISYRVARWNLIVYMDGDNSLDEIGIQNINAMELAGPGSTSSVNVFVLYDRSAAGEWTGTRLYKINSDWDLDHIHSQVIEDYGELDMSNPVTLRDFIIKCYQLSPADHTILTLWGHGDGVLNGLCQDESTPGDNFLSIVEVRTALEEARAVTGRKIDIVNMDVCSMQMLEVAYEWKDEVDFLVGSEAETPTDGNNYYGILQSLKNSPISTRDAAIAIVDAWYDWWSTSTWDRTYSALSLGDDFDRLISDFQTFATLLNAITDPTNRTEVRNSRSASTLFPSSASALDYMDLHSFADQLINHLTGSTDAVKNAAAALITDLNSVVIRDVNTSNMVGNAHGVSILLPADSGYWAPFSVNYSNYNLSQNTDWNEFIQNFVVNF